MGIVFQKVAVNIITYGCFYSGIGYTCTTEGDNAKKNEITKKLSSMYLSENGK